MEKDDVSGIQLIALRKIALESRCLDGDFQIQSQLGTGIGLVMIRSLIQLGLVESGFSRRHDLSLGYRPTPLGLEVEKQGLRTL